MFKLILNINDIVLLIHKVHIKKYELNEYRYSW